MKEKINIIKEIISFVDDNCQEHKIILDKFIKKYIKKEHRLNTIIKQSDKLQMNLLQLNEELNDFSNNLELKVKEEIAKRKDRDKMLAQQSKMAAMGEMIDAVAHQWKQPLTIIGLNTEMLSMDFEDNLIDAKYIDDFSAKIKQQLDHLINTLDEFRSFFRPNQNTSNFDIKLSIENVLLLMKDTLLSNQIEIIYDKVENKKLLGIENEFKHVLINIINNSKDAFNENQIKNRVINIITFENDKNLIIEISDNAGGIPEKVLPNIFKPNVTTKSATNGTGIGLYMSKQIIEKMNGDIQAINIDNGVKFILFFKGT
jgi:signal transduction histidine kinase